MNKRYLLWSFLALLAALPLLAACGSDDETKPDTTKAEEPKPAIKTATIKAPTPICPQVGVVRGLDVVRDYAGENPDPSQLVAAAKLLGTDGDCEYTDEGVDITFNANMAARRGQRLGGRHASFPMFVAVLDPTDTILNKNQMTADIDFSSDDAEVNHVETMHVFIPLARDRQPLGPQYRVLAGFQLTLAQAEEAKAALKP